MNNISPSPNKDHNVFKQGMDNYQVTKYKEIEKYYLSETIKLSLLTGPLYLISANMQFMTKSFPQVIPSKFSFFPQNIPNVTFNLPFKPTFYKNIKECVFNLRRQGILGFYKGNVYRLLFVTGTNKLKKLLDPYLSQYKNISSRLKELMLYCFVDIILNPLLFIESIYSIQNRRPGFRIYNNLFEVVSKSWRELYVGASYSIPRNIIFLLALNTYYIYPSQYLQYFSVFLAHLLSYPILTLQRNKIYHSSNTEYLPKNESMGSFSKQLIKEFGLFSLYRGFTSYIMATLLWHIYVPTMAKAKFYKNALRADKDILKMDFFEDDEYNEEDFDEKEIIKIKK